MSLRSLVTRHAASFRGAAASSSASSSSLRTFSTTPSMQYRGIEGPDSGIPAIDEPLEDLDAEESEPTSQEINTLAHMKIHRHRELLGYYRLAVHDFPKLAEFRQPYRPHDETNDLLTFRNVHFQGEARAGTNKSTLTVNVDQLFASKHFSKATTANKRKFLHLAGTHWIPDNAQAQEVFRLDGDYSDVAPPAVGIVKISCDRFPYESQNAKWCSDRLDQLIRVALENEDGSENISALPLDMRPSETRKAKKLHQGGVSRVSIADWPKEWKTPRQNSGSVGQKQSS